ncbi:MAG: hypothetical protein POH28_08155 [Acidocella sp.]|nr:hypothetical protein [Acidocella sp.]
MNELPFRLDMQAHGAVIYTRHSVSLPDGIEANDQIPYAAQPSEILAILLQQNVSTKTSHRMVISRAGHLMPVRFRLVAQPAMNKALDIASDLTLFGILGLGLVTLWRGRNWTAWGLSLFSFSVMFGSASTTFILPPPLESSDIYI